MFTRRLIDPEVVDWQFEQFEWLIDTFSTGPGLPDSDLVLPTPVFFPAAPHGQNQSNHVLGLLREQCAINPDDVIELQPQAGPPEADLGGLAFLQTTGQLAGGTYQFIPKDAGGPREIIRFDAALETQPTRLIATFAHELSHALHYRAGEPLDVDPELYELFTDLTAIYLGYGIFLANTRFEFSQMQDGDRQGWQARGAGYLPEADMIFATALFMRIKGIPPGVAAEHLKPRLRKMLKKAKRQLDGMAAEVEALRDRVPPEQKTRAD